MPREILPVRGTFDNGKFINHPNHKFVNNWLFNEDEYNEAALAHYVAEVGEKNGLTNNDVMKVFPFILRMLKSNIAWSE
jgi:hypothetical protein